MRPRVRIGDPLPSYDGEKNQSDAHDRCFQHAPGANKAQVQAQQDGDRNGHGECEGRPGGRFQSVDNDQGDHREKNNHDHQHRKLRNEAAALAHLLTRHLPQRFAIAANRTKQDHEILHAASERRTSNQPERSGQIPELRRECGAHERAWTGNGGKMVAEENPFVSGHEVAAIVMPFGRSSASVVQRQQPRRNESGVQPVGKEVGTECGDDKPNGVQGLTSTQGDGAECACPQERDACPRGN